MRKADQHRSLLLVTLAITLSLLLGGCASTGTTTQPGENIVLNEEQNALFNAAMVQMEQENYQAGIDLLEKVVAQNNASAVPRINMAIAYKKLEKIDKAEEELQAALDIEPNNPVANNEYALLLRKKGQFVEARQTYEKILTKYPEFALANKNLGVLCDIYIKDYQCALDAYQAYSAVKPKDDEVKIWISDLEMRTQ